MQMKTALMIAGGVGLVGFLIYRAKTAPAKKPTDPGPTIIPPKISSTKFSAISALPPHVIRNALI